jgi:hypothetical protein
VVLRAKKLEIQKQNCENCARAEKKKQTNKNKYCAMILSQIRRGIELHVCMREIIFLFEMSCFYLNKEYTRVWTQSVVSLYDIVSVHAYHSLYGRELTNHYISLRADRLGCGFECALPSRVLTTLGVLRLWWSTLGSPGMMMGCDFECGLPSRGLAILGLLRRVDRPRVPTV